MLVSCALEPQKEIVIKTVSDCNIVPYINITVAQIDEVMRYKKLIPLIIEINQQTKIIDLCKK